MLKLPLPVLFLFSAVALAQSPTPATPLPQLSPKAAYYDAIHPLELTRRSMSNWSDTEVAALTVSMTHAGTACAARDPKTFSGADLIDLAKLCALGQNSPAVIDAASRYIAADGPKLQLTQAYAALIDAQLHLKDEPDALASAQAMLTAVPYDTLTAETLDEAIGFMQFVYTPDALTLAVAREPYVLARISATAVATPDPSTYPGAEPAQSLHELYADGISLAALQQLDKASPDSITTTLTALDAALPAALAPDDALPIASLRRRYALLGQPLPDLARPTHPAAPHKPVAPTFLGFPSKLPQLPAPNAITAMLLFPDWCAQCLRMDIKLPPTVFTVAGHEAFAYGLLAETVAPHPPPTGATAATAVFTAADAANDLRGTPTVVVDASFLDQFAVGDVPFLIVTDSQGIVRVVQSVTDDAIDPGGTIDSAIARVGAQWPSPRLAPPLAVPRTGSKAR